jgi:hypothetical protein
MSATGFFTNSLAATTSFGALQYTGTGPATATGSTNWKVGKTAAGPDYGTMIFGGQQATFGTTVLPSAAPATTDAFVVCSGTTPIKFSGSFAATTWALKMGLIAVRATVAGGNLRCRVWRSTILTGSWTELTAATIAFTAVASLTTSTQQNTTASWSPGTVTLAGEFIAINFAWEITSASSSNLSEVALVTDATNSIITFPAFAATGAIAESITAPTDAVTRAQVLGRSIADSITAPSDALTRSLVQGRAIAESITNPSDLVTRAFVGLRSLSESVPAPTDSLTRAQVLARSIADSIGAPTDAVTRLVAAVAALSETIGLPTDVVARALVQSRALSESISAPSDSLSRAQVLARSVAESVTAPSDAVTGKQVLIRAVSESVVAPSDSLTRQVVEGRSVSESVTAPTDAASRAGSTFARGTSESIPAPTDAVSTQQVVSRAVSESVLGPSDTLTRAFVGTRSIAEIVSAPADSLVRAGTFARGAAESISAPSDAVSTQQVLVRALTESVSSPSDAVMRAIVVSRALSEALTPPADTVSTEQVLGRSISESVATPTDAVARTFTGGRGVAETIPAPADAVSQTTSGGGTNFTRVLSESIPSPTDAPVRSQVLARQVLELVTEPTDAVTTSQVLGRAVSEAMPAPSDSVSRQIMTARFVSEGISPPTDSVSHGGATRAVAEFIAAPVDAVSRQVAAFRTISESIPSPSDSVSRMASMANQIRLAFTISTSGTIFTPAQASAKLQAVKLKLYDNPVTDPVLGQLFGLSVQSDVGTTGASSATRTITLNMTSAAGIAPPPFPAHPITASPPQLPYPLTTTRALAGTFLVTTGSNLVTTSATQLPAILPGDTIEFLSQRGVQYRVLFVTPSTVTLITPYTGKSATTGAFLRVPAPVKLAAIYSTSDRDTGGIASIVPPIDPGSGAQSVLLRYLDSTGAGPFTVVVQTLGKTPVPVVLAPGSQDIAVVIDMEVDMVGPFGNSVGQITLSELAEPLPLIPQGASELQFLERQDKAQNLLRTALVYLPPSYFALVQPNLSFPELAGDFIVTTDQPVVFTKVDQTGVLAPGNVIQFASQMTVNTPFATLRELYTVKDVSPTFITLTRPYKGVDLRTRPRPGPVDADQGYGPANQQATGAYRVSPTLASPPSNDALKSPIGEFVGTAGSSPAPPPPPNPTVLSNLFAQTISLALAVPVQPQPITLF